MYIDLALFSFFVVSFLKVLKATMAAGLSLFFAFLYILCFLRHHRFVSLDSHGRLWRLDVVLNGM